MHKMIVNGSLLLIGVVFAQMTAHAQKTETSSGIGYTVRPGDASGPSTEYIDITRNGKSYRMVRSGDKIKEFYIDDRRIPDDSIASYHSVIKKIDEQVRLDRERSEKDEVQAEKDRSHASLDKQQAERDRQQAMMDREQTEKDKQMAEQDMQQAQKDKQMAEQDMQQASRDKQLSYIDQQEAKKARERAYGDKVQAEKEMQFYKQQLRNLAADLVKDHIIDVKSDLSGMGLSDQEMIVNGKRQSSSVHERYKKKYLRQEGMGLYYGNVELGNGVFFEKKDLKDL
jgi:hypothetical protein